MMRPSLWDRLHTARQEAVTPNAPAGAHMTLGNIYNELATTSIRPRYLRALFSRSRQQPTVRQKSQRLIILIPICCCHNSTRPALNSVTRLIRLTLSLAVNELAVALEHGVRDPVIVETVSQNFATLVARARLQGDFDTANSYLKRLEELAGASEVSLESETLAEERRRLVIDWVTTVLHDQGPGPARAVLEDNFGQESSLPANAQFARLNSLHVATETKLGERVITIEIAPRSDGEALVQSLYEALSNTGIAEVDLYDTQPLIIRIGLPFEDDIHLLDKQQTLAAAIPSEPEWALLSSVLRPQSLAWKSTDEGWRTTDDYEEDSKSDSRHCRFRYRSPYPGSGCQRT